MGMYLEPRGDKQQFFTMHGKLKANKPDDTLVAFLANGAFCALGVVTDKKELERFKIGRPDAVYRWIGREEIRAAGALSADELKYVKYSMEAV